MSETREAGWYWVTWNSETPPEPGEWSVTEIGFLLTGTATVLSEDDFAEIGPRVQTPAEIAAAIAAARAEGVAIGAANMRETCKLVAKSASPGSPPAHERIAALALPTDADAILRAERVKGAEAAIAAFKLAEVWKADNGLPSIDVVADRVRLLVTP